MVEFFRDGGHMMWVILLSAVLAGGLTVKAALGLRRDGARAAAALGSTVDAVLFWGGFALVAGVLGTTVGISMVAQAIGAASGSISAGIVWDGIRVALITTIFGAVVCGAAGLAWLTLRTVLLRRRRSLMADA